MNRTSAVLQRIGRYSPTKNIFIKNFKSPICKECVYFQNSGITKEYAKCVKFGERDIVLGNINYQSAIDARNNESYCGIEAKEFIPKQLTLPVK